MSQTNIDRISSFGYSVLAKIRDSRKGISYESLCKYIGMNEIDLSSMLHFDLIFQVGTTKNGVPMYTITSKGLLEIFNYERVAQI